MSDHQKNDTQNSIEDATNAETKTLEPEATVLNEQEVAELKQQLKTCESIKDQFSRLTADFQNHKKRAELEKTHIVDATKMTLLLGILKIVDDFDRALGEAKKNGHAEFTSWIQGFELIHKSLYDFLESQKVTPIKQLTEFNPHLHEAVLQVQEDGKESGTIVKVFENGFMYKDQVLRTAKVSVAA